MADVNPVTYKAPEPVYVDGMYHNANTPFTTSAEKGGTWERIDGGEKAAMEASDKTLDVQPSLEDLNIEALRALAATKNVAVTAGGRYLKEDALRAAIRAADEPRL